MKVREWNHIQNHVNTMIEQLLPELCPIRYVHKIDECVFIVAQKMHRAKMNFKVRWEGFNKY